MLSLMVSGLCKNDFLAISVGISMTAGEKMSWSFCTHTTRDPEKFKSTSHIHTRGQGHRDLAH